MSKKILVHYPTRERFFQFEFILKLAYELSVNKNDIHYLVSYDEDDTNFDINKAKTLIPGNCITFICGKSENKIHACNRDVKEYKQDWDIVMLLSDDMVCKFHDWDGYVRDEFEDSTDLCVHFNDGYRPDLMTLALLGREYYDRFGYIYNPVYKSLFCDDEMMQVAIALKKYKYSSRVLFSHEHYSNTRRVKPDDLMRRTESFYKEDKATFEMRKAINFGL